ISLSSTNRIFGMAAFATVADGLVERRMPLALQMCAAPRPVTSDSGGGEGGGSGRGPLGDLRRFYRDAFLSARAPFDGRTMNTRPFASTGFNASEVGLGCWQLGGTDWGALDDASGLAILGAAADAGVNFFDTADVYGAGRSETLVGRLLRESKREIFVATKLGRTAELYPDRYTEAGLRAATEASLRRLGVETIDLTQLHCVPTEVMRRGEVFEW